MKELQSHAQLHLYSQEGASVLFSINLFMLGTVNVWGNFFSIVGSFL